MIRFVLASMMLLLVAALTPAVASDESPEEQQACMYDAFRVCGHAIPSRERVIECFRENLNELSPLCRGVMVRHNKPVARGRQRITTSR